MWPLFTVVAFAGLPPIDEPVYTGARSPEDVAVVIGLEDYLLVPDVPHARRDAQAFRDTLVYSRGIPPERVQLLTRGGREGMWQAVERAVDQVGPKGTVWLYFAGHGAADPATGQRLLLGDDVRPDPEVFAARGLPLAEVLGRIEASGASGVLVLDTCYGGVSRGGESLIPGSRFMVPAFAAKPPPSITVWTATSADELAMPLPSVRHGAFTYFAIGALRGWADGVLDGEPDGVLTVREAQEYVSQALRAAGVQGQQPELQGDPGRVLLAGELERGPDLRAVGASSVGSAPPTGSSPGASPSKAPVAVARGQQTGHLDADLAQARELILATLHSLGWRVTADEAEVIRARVPMGLTSAGERLTVLLEETANGQTVVGITADPIHPLSTNRRAREQTIIRRFFNRMESIQR